MDINSVINGFENDCKTLIDKFMYELVDYDSKKGIDFFVYASNVAYEAKIALCKLHYDAIQKQTTLNVGIFKSLVTTFNNTFDIIDHTMEYARNYNECIDYLYKYCIDNSITCLIFR